MQFFASPSAVSILAARRRLPWGILILAESKGHLMTQAELRPAVAAASAELEFGSARKYVGHDSIVPGTLETCPTVNMR